VRDAVEAPIRLRAATQLDASFVEQLAARAFGEYDPHAARTTLGLMRRRGARTLVAERAERPLGFVILQQQSRTVLGVDALAVIEQERGRGLGQLLMRAAERLARQRGFAALALSTAQANLAALDLFLRLGFVITERAGRYYFGGQPACQLVKRLI
jgi:ribosomal protein S18 acetylase RimI-like enzyme